MLSIKEMQKEIYSKQKEYLEDLRVNDPGSYEKLTKARYDYYKGWRERNPNYNKAWLKKAYRKDPERFKEYQRRHREKKRASKEVKENEAN